MLASSPRSATSGPRQSSTRRTTTTSWCPAGGFGQRRIHGCALHLDIIDGKIWVQYDGTSEPVADELERAGVPKEDIVLAFHPPDVRPHTGYAVA